MLDTNVHLCVKHECTWMYTNVHKCACMDTDEYECT